MNPFLDEIDDDEPEEIAEADPAASGFSRMKCKLRAELEQRIAKFLERGGQIEQLEFGMRRTLDWSYNPGELRAELEQHIAEFLERGGQIEQLEFGMRRTLDWSYNPGDTSINDSLFRK